MRRTAITDMAHDLILSNVDENSIIVDATCGNGHDTLFLAERVKQVHAFDIQKQAILNTKELTKNYSNIKFHEISHEFITSEVEDYDGVIFNLGYLPGSDKSIKTTDRTTINALNELHKKQVGFVLMVVYPGHSEGEMELSAIQSWLKRKALEYELIELPYETKNKAPLIFFWKY